MNARVLPDIFKAYLQNFLGAEGVGTGIARSHGATVTANYIKNCHKMALYSAMMG